MTGRMQRVDRKRLQELMREGAQVVEVLPDAEFQEEHIAGAINIPLKRMDAEAVKRLDGQRPVVVYCNSYT